MTNSVQKGRAFPRVQGRERGYDIAEVDEILANARAAYEANRPDYPTTATSIREAAFRLVRRGYTISAVDSALSRVEDALAAQEREREIARLGADGWVAQNRANAQEVLNRLSRPAGQKFDRTGRMRFGYRVAEVDYVADKIVAYLTDGAPVTPQQVRQVAFRLERGGYREGQVDALLDAVIEIMLAVR